MDFKKSHNKIIEKKASQTPQALFELLETDPYADQRQQADELDADFFAFKMQKEFASYEQIERLIMAYMSRPTLYDFAGLFNKPWAWTRNRCVLNGKKQGVHNTKEPEKETHKVPGFETAFKWFKYLPTPQKDSLREQFSRRLLQLRSPYEWEDWSSALVKALLVRAWRLETQKNRYFQNETPHETEKVF